MTDAKKQVRVSFLDLKERLARFVESAKPTDKNPHFASYQQLDPDCFTVLTQLAHEGRTRVDEHSEYFLQQALYDDGMYWYELFLAISSAALSYEQVTGNPLVSRELETLVVTLVLMTRYTTVQQGDITKRNREALGNLLLMAPGDQLSEVALEKAASLREPLIVEFVQDTIETVKKIDGENPR